MKRIVIVLAVVLAAVLFVSIPATYKDGGTQTYTSLTYKIIRWNSMDDSYEDGYKTGTKIYWFPNNFKGLDEYR